MTDVGVAALAITQGISAFQNFLPPLSDVRKRDAEDSDFAGDVRMGEVAACCLTVGIGAVVSSLTGDPVPVYVAVLVSVGLVFMYEATLRKDKPMQPGATADVYRFTGPETMTERA